MIVFERCLMVVSSHPRRLSTLYVISKVHFFTFNFRDCDWVCFGIRWQTGRGCPSMKAVTMSFGMQPRVLILLMEEILHQLIGSLSHYLKGFIHPRWLFGISSINSMSRLFGHLFIAWSAYFLMYIASFNQVMCFRYHFGTRDLEDFS